MIESLSPAREDAPSHVLMPRRGWRVLLAVALLVVTVPGGAYTAAFSALSQMFRSIFSSSAAQGIAPSFLDRMLVGGPGVGYVVGAAYWVLVAATLVLAVALVTDARGTERALPAWGGMALWYAALVLLATERPELPEQAAVCAGWVVWVALVAWGTGRTEPRAAPAG